MLENGSEATIQDERSSFGFADVRLGGHDEEKLKIIDYLDAHDDASLRVHRRGKRNL